ncbi:hypothetical protein BAUCODRAFT_138258 [Baudoinia panamericana UAMH 10762]|uniref:3-phytase n=1 Tax=Baudoinia panamericana (strain UAMH 10762) TaxID=717646 RepID=M2LV91_BAUPA|nr:uncharacterized protein BAUCODRAFT_138258 [Baudoinia panamericana UAMH 10762]EMC98522.1 hypothetical protein BAUCODRAFT_138258 [Baudoinia panamericana UAMH 10762]
MLGRHRHGARSPATGPVPGDSTPWYQCGNPDEFTFTNEGDYLEPGRSPYMKEQITIDGLFNYTFWQGNCDLGELTSLGSLRMQAIGRTLRSVYVDQIGFLPQQMDSGFQISHTYIWRTRESVENLFAGLYPIQYRQPTQTLTMHVKPQNIEVMISNPTACPRLGQLTTAFTTSSTYLSALQPFNALQSTLVAAYGTQNVSGWNTTQTLYDTASAEYCHGLGTKGNITGSNIQSLVIPGTASYHELFRSNPMAEQAKQLAVGPWLSQILASFYDRSTTLQVYSAHDASLDMFLSVVANPDLPWPPFSSSVEIELWQHNTMGLVVRMYYEGMIVPAHPNLNCSFTACPLGTLQAFMSRYILPNYRTACAAA